MGLEDFNDGTYDEVEDSEQDEVGIRIPVHLSFVDELEDEEEFDELVEEKTEIIKEMCSETEEVGRVEIHRHQAEIVDKEDAEWD